MEWIRRMRLGLGRRIGTIGVLGASIALGLCAPCAIAQMNDISLQDITRLRGHGSDRLWGIGLVMGLGNSGDSNDVLPKARQIAQLLQHAGSPIPGIDEAMRTRSVAIVMVSVRLPEEGVVVGDEFHLDVQTMFDAKSLQGGNLFLTPMRGAMPGDPYIYAMGAGKVTIEGSTPTSARVSNGCRIIRDIEKPVISNHGTLTLQVRENYASHTTTTLIANLINQDRQGLRADGMAPIARA
ncbi:MAG: flagellar basal body P-ring protein FlgI, partial [Phycisphaerales bacterium]